jgi:hypothetical protein
MCYDACVRRMQSPRWYHTSSLASLWCGCHAHSRADTSVCWCAHTSPSRFLTSAAVTHTPSVRTEMRGQRHNHAPSGPGVRWAAEPAANPKSDVTVCRDRPVVVKINRGPNQAPSTTAAARRRLIDDQFRQASNSNTTAGFPSLARPPTHNPINSALCQPVTNFFFIFSVVCPPHSIPL